MSGFDPQTEVVVARSRDELASVVVDVLAALPAPARPLVLSVRVADAGLLVATPDIATGALAPETLLLADLEGRVVSRTPGADGRAPAALGAHARVYRELDGIGGIAQAGSGAAAAWAAAERPLPVLGEALAHDLGAEVPLAAAPGARAGALGEILVAALAEARAVLVPGHGLVVAGRSPREAAELLVRAECAAATAWMARGIAGAA